MSASTTPLGERTTMIYDTSGRMTSRVDPRGNVAGAHPADYTTDFTYNNADQKLTETDANGHDSTWVYDPAGNLASVTDANGHTTGYAYDADDELTSVTAPGGASTSYTYDANGNLATRTDPNGHVTTYSYDDANRLASTTDPLARVWAYAYDANGNQTSVTAPGGGAISDSYDVLNRLSGVDYSDATPDVSFGYDGDGNRTQMVDGAGTVSYAYDDLGRLLGVARGSDTFAYSYDAAGDVVSRVYPGGTAVSYGYDDDGRLASVSSGGATTGYAYDAAGELVATTRPSGNGWVESRVYDRAGRLTEIKDANGAAVLQQLDYTYDPAGNALSLVGPGGSEFYEYDSRDRLSRVCYGAPCAGATATISWAYDSVGNRLSETRPAGTTSYVYDAADELTGSSGLGGGVVYGYDGRGDQTSAGGAGYGYDLAGRLTSATVAGATTAYGYDGDGNRLSATAGASTVGYLWDTNNELPELALERTGAGGLLRSYVRGLDTVALIEGGARFYYHHDRLGSVTALTSASGASEWLYSYEPFGSPRATSQPDPLAPVNPLGFTGQYQDPGSGLLNLRARQYDEASGRFQSTDPAPAGPTEPYTNAYDYAGQDPINNYDLAGTNATFALHPAFGIAFVFAAWGSTCITNPACRSGSSLIIKKIADLFRQARARSPNQANGEIKKGNAPPGIERIDPANPDIPGNQDHAHLDDGTVINRDGTTSHDSGGTPKPTNKQKRFLRRYGFKV
jgi:RHS repeat-associated protein